MKLIYLLQIMLAQLMFILLAASMLANDEKKKQQGDGPEHDPLIPTNSTEEGKKSDFASKGYALIPAYVMAAGLLLVFLPWSLWRIIRNWGSWKIHTRSPRPRYIRTAFGWVDQETWELKQQKRAKRKEAKRYRHKIYRTTKASYKWIFYDPTGELQQRYRAQKERSYLRLLPSWMRSYPHGTIQPGVSTQQCKALRGIYPFPELPSTNIDHPSISESLGDGRLDLPEASSMEYLDIIFPSTAKQSCLLPKLPMTDAPDVIQVWRVRGNPLPERMGRPPLETEEELRGEVESPEEVIRRDTERRLQMGRSQQTTNQSGPELTLEGDIDRLMTVARPLPRMPPVFNRRLVQDSPGLEPGSLAVRRQIHIEGLESRIQEVRIDATLMLVRGTLDILIRQLRRASGDRRRRTLIASRPTFQHRPVPDNLGRALELQQHIEDLERRIHELRTEPTSSPERGTLDSLLHELRGARATRDRLPPIAVLHHAVPTSQFRPQNNQANRFGIPIPNTAEAVEPRRRVIMGSAMTVRNPDTRAVMDSIDRLDRLANNHLQTHLRDAWNRSDVLVVPASATTVDAFNDLFQRLTATRVRASTPTIVTPQIQTQANRAVIEGPATNDHTDPNLMSEEDIHEGGNRPVTRGPSANDNLTPDPTLEEDIPPETQNPIAAALLRSLPDYEANLQQADPAARRHIDSEESLRADAIRQTAAFYTEIGSSNHAPDVRTRVQEVQTGDEAAAVAAHSPASSTASVPDVPVTEAQATAAAATVSRDLEDALN